MYLSFFLNCLATLLFSNLDLKPESALVFYGQCKPAVVSRLPESALIKTATKKPATPEVSLIASSGAVLLVNNNSFLFEKNATAQQPIASLTKLMTALVFLDHNPGFDKNYVVTSADNVVGGKNNLFIGDTVKVKDLLNTSLIASDNAATMALAHATGLSATQFVAEMNKKAAQLGLFNTSFTEPTGLSDKNVSTARDVARLAKEALAHEDIKQATTKKEYSFTTVEGREKKISSTDYLLYSESASKVNLLGGKTGYTESAGYCFVGKFANDNQDEIISVVLNSNSKDNRFVETKTLVDWIFTNFNFNR